MFNLNIELLIKKFKLSSDSLFDSIDTSSDLSCRDEHVDLVCSFISVYRLDVHEGFHYAVLKQYAISTTKISGHLAYLSSTLGHMRFNSADLSHSGFVWIIELAKSDD